MKNLLLILLSIALGKVVLSVGNHALESVASHSLLASADASGAAGMQIMSFGQPQFANTTRYMATPGTQKVVADGEASPHYMPVVAAGSITGFSVKASSSNITSGGARFDVLYIPSPCTATTALETGWAVYVTFQDAGTGQFYKKAATGGNQATDGGAISNFAVNVDDCIAVRTIDTTGGGGPCLAGTVIIQ